MRRKLLTQKQVNLILDQFNIGSFKRKSHVDITIENQNYEIVTTKGKYLLKIFDSTNNYKDLAFQNNLLEYLYKRRVRVPEIIKNKEGKTLTAFNGKYLSVYQFIEGKHLKTLTTELAKSLAKEIAKMHRVLLQYKPAGMGRRLNYARKDLNVIKKKKLRRLVIHGDLGKLNILARDKNIVAILDFNDARWDFLIKDLAVLTTIFLNEPNLKYMPIFYTEYQRLMKLHKDELVSLDFFILTHIKGVLKWLENQRKARTKEHLKHIDNAIIYYKDMLKIAYKF